MGRQLCEVEEIKKILKGAVVTDVALDRYGNFDGGMVFRKDKRYYLLSGDECFYTYDKAKGPWR